MSQLCLRIRASLLTLTLFLCMFISHSITVHRLYTRPIQKTTNQLAVHMAYFLLGSGI